MSDSGLIYLKERVLGGMQEDTKDFLEQLERVRWERHVVSCKRELTCSAKSLSAGVSTLGLFYLIFTETLIGTL